LRDPFLPKMVSVRLRQVELAKIDAIVESHKHPWDSRSEFIRQALIRELRRLDWEDK